MALSIQSQVLRMAQAARLMGSHQANVGRLSERTASGSRINRASDDAAGLSLAESLRTQVRGNAEAAKNILDAGSLLNVADAAVSGISDALLRMRELAVQSANGVFSDAQRANMELEFAELKSEINFVTREANFNGYWLLRGGEPSGWTTAPARTETATYSGQTNTKTITPQLQTFPAGSMGTNGLGETIAPLGASPEVYGLGTAGPESIVVEAFDTATATTRTIPFDATNGYSFDAGTDTVTFHGTGTPIATEEIRVRYVPAGSTTLPLSGTPVAGTMAVTANGVPVADAGGPAGNGYYLSGGTVSLVGAARPDATDPPLTLAAAYQTQTPDTIVLNLETPNFEGGLLDAAGMVVTVNAVPLAPGDYTIIQTPVEEVGTTMLYTYTIRLNAGAIPTGAGPHTLSATYAFDHPTGVDPLQFDVQAGANEGMIRSLLIDRLTVGGLSLGDQHIRTQAEAQSVLSRLNTSVEEMTGLRSRIGAYVNSLEHSYNNVLSQRESMAKAESHIRDADMALEVSEVTRKMILRDGAGGMMTNIRQNASYLIQLLG